MGNSRKIAPVALLVASLAAGCASTAEQESIVARNDAIEDYVVVSELEELDQIRKRGELYHTVVTKKYILLKDRRNVYLATFAQPCWNLDELRVEPDYRHDSDTIKARFDTYRGCRIHTLHGLTEGQEKEILALAEKTAD